MHEAPQYSFVLENSPVFHRQTEEDESVHTFRGSFFRPVLAGTRSNDGRRAGMARSFVQINFQRGQGYTRERLRFADRNCRNRDRWIFQRILCSVLAPPRLTAHTFRCQFPIFPSPLSLYLCPGLLGLFYIKYPAQTKFSWTEVASRVEMYQDARQQLHRCIVAMLTVILIRISRQIYWFTCVTSLPRFEKQYLKWRKEKELFILAKIYRVRVSAWLDIKTGQYVYSI